MPSGSKAARGYREAEGVLRYRAGKEDNARQHWQSARASLDAVVGAGRSSKTVKKAQNYERNAREKYEDATAGRREAQGRRENALRRLEVEEATSARLGGDIGSMVAREAYQYGRYHNDHYY